MLAQEMLAQELAARFGPKLREIEPLGQRLPAANVGPSAGHRAS